MLPSTDVFLSVIFLRTGPASLMFWWLLVKEEDPRNEGIVTDEGVEDLFSWWRLSETAAVDDASGSVCLICLTCFKWFIIASSLDCSLVSWDSNCSTIWIWTLVWAVLLSSRTWLLKQKIWKKDTKGKYRKIRYSKERKEDTQLYLYRFSPVEVRDEGVEGVALSITTCPLTHSMNIERMSRSHASSSFLHQRTILQQFSYIFKRVKIKSG